MPLPATPPRSTSSPAATQNTTQGDPAERQKAVAALDRVWASLGFEHFRNGIHVLDLNLTTLDENLAQLRKNAERYHTFRD